MKFRIEVVMEDESGGEMQRIVAMERQCIATDTPICGLGLTIMDRKNSLGTVQEHLIESEVNTISSQHTNCEKWAASLKRKDVRQSRHPALAMTAATAAAAAATSGFFIRLLD